MCNVLCLHDRKPKSQTEVKCKPHFPQWQCIVKEHRPWCLFTLLVITMRNVLCLHERKPKSQTEAKLNLIFPYDSALHRFTVRLNIVRDVYLLISSSCVMCCVYTILSYVFFVNGNHLKLLSFKSHHALVPYKLCAGHLQIVILFGRRWRDASLTEPAYFNTISHSPLPHPSNKHLLFKVSWSLFPVTLLFRILNQGFSPLWSSELVG